MNKRKGLLGSVVLGFGFILLIIVLMMCTTKVPAGYVAVQYDMNGGLKDEVLTQGFHITSPTVTTKLYTVGIEQSYLTSDKNGDSREDESFVGSSKEGKAITIDLTFSYQYKAKDVVDVYNRFKGQNGEDVKNSFVKPNIISWTKEVVCKYPVSDIIGSKRSDINADLTEYISKKFEPFGISISNVSLINVDVDKDTMAAINKKIEAQQKAETQKINNQTAIEKAEADKKVAITEAEANAEKKRIKSEAEANSIKIIADAEAYANKKVGDSLSEIVVKKTLADNWDGKLSKFGNIDGLNTLFNVD